MRNAKAEHVIRSKKEEMSEVCPPSGTVRHQGSKQPLQQPAFFMKERKCGRHCK